MPSEERDYNPYNEGEEGLRELGEDWLDTLFKPHRGRESGPISPFNYTVRRQPVSGRWTEQEMLKSPQERFEERSEASREADKSFNAPYPPTYQDWVEQPNRYDIPGVDTIPKERQRQRAERLADRAQRTGVVSRIEEKETIEGGWGGLFRGVTRTIDIKPHETPHTLAHEVGHAIDHAAGVADSERSERRYYHDWMSERAVGAENVSDAEDRLEIGMEMHRTEHEDVRMDEQTLDELWQISQRGRGRQYSDYRRSMTEVAADAFAHHNLEPRAIRRDYPKAASWMERAQNLAFREGSD